MKSKTCVAGLLSLVAWVAHADQPLDGQWDMHFGNSGVQRYGFDLVAGSGDRARAIAIAPSGLIYVAGEVETSDGNGGTYRQAGLSRITPGGQLDTTFSGDGKIVSTPAALSLHNVFVEDLIVRADGKPIIAMAAAPPNNVLSYQTAICRYNVAGNLDTGFDGDGCAQPDPAFVVGGFNSPAAIAELPGQGVLVAGYASRILFNLVDTVGFVMRLTSSGAVDPSFGQGGVLTLWPPGTDEVYVTDLVHHPDGYAYAIGSTEQDVWIARFSDQGVLDAGFGASGYAHVSYADLQVQPGKDFASAIALDDAGRIYACGYTRFNSNIYQSIMSIARFTPNGALDPDFSGDGRILMPYVDVFPFSTVTDCKVDRSGRLVAGLHTGTTNPISGDFAAVRFKVDGSADETFNLAGQVRVGIDAGGAPGLGHETVAAIALQGPDIVIAGTASAVNGDGANDPIDFAVIRLRSDQLLRDGFEQ